MKKWIAIIFTVAALVGLRASDPFATETVRLKTFDYFISQLPESYETKVGERGYGLSGGQRQRIALARAILRKPRVLILDDALSAVDASTEEEIRSELNQVMSNMTTLIITNRVPTIELCDEVVFLENGKVKAQGKHQDLMDAVDSYKSLFLENQTSEI